MSDIQPAAYRSLLSVKNRRLRVIGGTLLSAVALMAVYGYFGMMPAFRRATSDLNVERAAITRQSATTTPAFAAPQASRLQKVVLAKILFLYFYWSIWGALVLATLIVAWLDLREVTRAYDGQRQELWSEAMTGSRNVSTSDNGHDE